MMPKMARDVTVKNANLEMVAKRSLKTRFAIGTTSFSHLIIEHDEHVKSKNSVSG